MTDPIVLAVPNISEGRGEAIVAHIAGTDSLLDVHSDIDHNRSVLTYGASPERLIEACVAMVDRAAASLDIREHEGAHPRYGVVDVLPLIAHASEEADVQHVAAELTWRIAQGPGVPVYTYGRLSPDGRSLPELRWMLRKTRPPAHPSAGVICMSIRDPLIAFNVNAKGQLDGARRVCTSLRALPGIRALAFQLPSRNLVQISMNLTNIDETGPEAAYSRVVELAPAEHLDVVEAEIVGLVPEGVMPQLEELPLVRPARSIEQALRG